MQAVVTRKRETLEEKEERRNLLIRAIQHYDRHWFASRKRVKAAREFLESLGISAKGVRVGTLAKEHCEYWKVQEYRAPIGRSVFNAGEWERMRKWLSTEGRIDPARDTFSTVLARMRVDGVKVSQTGLREAASAAGITLPTSVATFDPGVSE